MAVTQQQQQQMAMNNMIQQQQKRSHCLMKLMQFSDALSSYPVSLLAEADTSANSAKQEMRTRDDLSYWNMFVHRFFSQVGVFRHSLHVTDSGDPDKQYEIAFPAIARYLHTHFGSGVRSIQLVWDKGIMDKPLPGDCHCIESQRASLVYWFESGSHVRLSTLPTPFY